MFRVWIGGDESSLQRGPIYPTLEAALERAYRFARDYAVRIELGPEKWYEFVQTQQTILGPGFSADENALGAAAPLVLEVPSFVDEPLVVEPATIDSAANPSAAALPAVDESLAVEPAVDSAVEPSAVEPSVESAAVEPAVESAAVGSAVEPAVESAAVESPAAVESFASLGASAPPTIEEPERRQPLMNSTPASEAFLEAPLTISEPPTNPGSLESPPFGLTEAPVQPSSAPPFLVDKEMPFDPGDVVDTAELRPPVLPRETEPPFAERPSGLERGPLASAEAAEVAWIPHPERAPLTLDEDASATTSARGTETGPTIATPSRPRVDTKPLPSGTRPPARTLPSRAKTPANRPPARKPGSRAKTPSRPLASRFPVRKEAKPQKERRRAPRTVSPLPPSQTESVAWGRRSVRLVDVSWTGARVSVRPHSAPHAGEVLVVEVRAYGLVAHLAGQVRWVREGECGIAFDESLMSRASIKLLERILGDRG